MPPTEVLATSCVIIGVVTTAALYFTLRRDLKLPVTAAIYGTVFEGLVVAVKFGLGPYGLYEVNERSALSEPLFGINDAIGATATAAAIFLLYLAVYWLLYRWARGRVWRADRERRRFSMTALPTVAVLVSVLGLGAGGWVLVVASMEPTAQYLSFVFSSGVAGVTAIALAAAAGLAAMTFRSTAGQVRALGDANLLVNVFVVGLVFLVLFHILWVVYILVVTSIWPLNTVMPK